jgi:putative transposase
LHGFTPAEVWRGIDPYEMAPKAIQMFEAWDGMLKGIRLIR